MPGFVKSVARVLLTKVVGRTLSFLLFRVTVEGKENLPSSATRPLIVIANHFSWFDAPILAIHLPFAPAFLVATESLRRWWVRGFIKLFDGIPIWRGQVDRNALRLSLDALKRGLILGIFPEGGMNPQNQERIARGEQIPEIRGHASRVSGTLVRGRSGSALLAVQSQAYILPVAIIGSEKILDNLRRFRRTPIHFRIGPVFGPLTLDETVRGPMRRAELDQLTDKMMRHIAVLFPPERRGPYADPVPDATEPATVGVEENVAL
jgi:1-acyl-sn-glycerol-3-phosphate acyltransferase